MLSLRTVEPPTFASPQLTGRRLLDNPLLAWALLVVGLMVLARLAFRGWIPHDEGTLGQAATRVLGGEVPHVDFHDTYGGLQAYAHAGAFSLLGESVRSLRVANIAMAATAGLASFGIVRRVQPIVVAASVGVAAMLVGFAVYPASMPSWWNAALGLATGWLVLRWLDTRNPLVLGAAGLLTGLSFLVKSTGAFAAAAVALFLIMLISPDSPRRKFFVALGALIVLLFGVLLAGAPSLHAIALLFVPLALAAFVGFRKESVPRMPGGQGVPLSAVTIFSLAVVVPVGIFALPYMLSGNGYALVSGWFRLPQLRFDSAAWSRSIPLLPLLLLAAVGFLTYWACRRINPRLVLGAWVVLIIVVASTGWQWWWTLALILIMLAPVAISAGMAASGWHSRLTTEHLLCALMLAAFTFIQYPVSNAIYAIYLVPWIVTALGVWIVGPNASRVLVAILLLTASIVAIRLEQGYLYASTPLAEPVELVALDVDRGGIDIPAKHGFYSALVNHLEPYAPRSIYAGPDSPEIYFLSGTANPTPVLFDFLAESWRIGELDTAVLDRQLAAVVVNNSPDFSSPLPQMFVEIVETKYPDRSSFGWFDVYEDPDSAN